MDTAGSPTAPLTGQAISRGEDAALVVGAAEFTADIPVANALFVAFVRSPYAKASVDRIDVSAALDAPGVVDAVGPSDLPELVEGVFSVPLAGDRPHPVLPSDTVEYVGQIIAAVVAESAEEAADAVELVDFELTPLTPLLDLDEAIAAEPVEGAGFETDHDESKFAADVVVRQRVWNPRQSPAPIEARSMACWWDESDHLHVIAATQRPHGFRDQLATMYELDPSHIHVTAPSVGGGFGGKVTRSAEQHLLPELARRSGRPVRWNETRSEWFASATQARGERLDLVLAGSADGHFQALRVELIKDGGAYPAVGVVLPVGYSKPMANGCYDIAHVEFATTSVRTNRPPTSAFRGAGRAPLIAALERTVDRFAVEAGLDPVEVRRRNLIRPDQMPYDTPTGGRYDEADYPADLESALAAFDYEGWRQTQASHNSGAGITHSLGVGVAAYNHMTLGGGGEEASVTINADGTATVITGSTSQGHGHATTWAQIAGDVLNMPIESIQVIEGSTDAIGSGVGAVGSRSLQTAGIAVHNSAEEVVERARQLAADHLEAAVSDIVANVVTSPLASSVAEPGFHVIGTPARSVSWATLAAEGLGSERELSCGEFYDSEGRNSFPSGVHIAAVEVDIETGGVDVLEFVAVDDAGPRVNPMIVEGQIHGGIASGIAQALGETMEFDEAGNPITSNFSDYAIGSIDQFPMFTTVAAAVPSSMNTLGFKGVGESGTVGATPAVHNAIVDALSHLGVRHIELPCTPLRIWEAIEAARADD